VVNMQIRTPLPGKFRPLWTPFVICKRFLHEMHICEMTSSAAPSSDARPSGGPGPANAAAGAAAGRGDAANGAAAGAHMCAVC
jgi:hypothetical protein